MWSLVTVEENEPIVEPVNPTIEANCWPSQSFCLQDCGAPLAVLQNSDNPLTVAPHPSVWLWNTRKPLEEPNNTDQSGALRDR